MTDSLFVPPSVCRVKKKRLLVFNFTGHPVPQNFFEAVKPHHNVIHEFVGLTAPNFDLGTPIEEQIEEAIYQMSLKTDKQGTPLFHLAATSVIYVVLPQVSPAAALLAIALMTLVDKDINLAVIHKSGSLIEFRQSVNLLNFHQYWRSQRESYINPIAEKTHVTHTGKIHRKSSKPTNSPGAGNETVSQAAT